MTTNYPVQPIQTKMPFYSLGQIDTSCFKARPFTRNSAVPDSGSNIINRNKYSINSESFQERFVKPKSDLSEMKNKSMNNYLQPLTQYKKEEK